MIAVFIRSCHGHSSHHRHSLRDDCHRLRLPKVADAPMEWSHRMHGIRETHFLMTINRYKAISRPSMAILSTSHRIYQCFFPKCSWIIKKNTCIHVGEEYNTPTPTPTHPHTLTYIYNYIHMSNCLYMFWYLSPWIIDTCLVHMHTHDTHTHIFLSGLSIYLLYVSVYTIVTVLDHMRKYIYTHVWSACALKSARKWHMLTLSPPWCWNTFFPFLPNRTQ